MTDGRQGQKRAGVVAPAFSFWRGLGAWRVCDCVSTFVATFEEKSVSDRERNLMKVIRFLLEKMRRCKEKRKKPSVYWTSSLAQKEGFEPSRRFTQPTPLAGEPLRPLGYFCKTGDIKIWRRERDSNPRYLSVSLVFKTSAINRSAISPSQSNQQRYYMIIGACCQAPFFHLRKLCVFGRVSGAAPTALACPRGAGSPARHEGGGPCPNGSRPQRARRARSRAPAFLRAAVRFA